MNRYWLGIGVGALAVFGVGMAGITAGRKGLKELKTAALAPVRALQDPVGALRFQLDGRPIGHIRALDLTSDGGWDAHAVRLRVQLDDGAEATGLADCNLVGEGLQHTRADARFRCVGPAEIGARNLVEIGQVRFDPVGLDRPLLVAERDRQRITRSEIRKLDASLASEDGRTVDGHATFDLGTGPGKRQRGVLQLHAGNGRALIDIRDDAGRQLFHLLADEHGVKLNARDERGRELLQLLAGSAGVSLKIDK